MSLFKWLIPWWTSPNELANECATDRARLFVAQCFDYSGGGWYDTGKRVASRDGGYLLPVLRYRDPRRRIHKRGAVK